MSRFHKENLCWKILNNPISLGNIDVLSKKLPDTAGIQMNCDKNVFYSDATKTLFNSNLFVGGGGAKTCPLHFHFICSSVTALKFLYPLSQSNSQ